MNHMIGVVASGARNRPNDGVRELRTAISKQLSLVPRGFPLAPEDDEFSGEIRQMIVGRYRVLFTIRKQKVHVLHIRGAYPAK